MLMYIKYVNNSLTFNRIFFNKNKYKKYYLLIHFNFNKLNYYIIILIFLKYTDIHIINKLILILYNH